jgi:hypothetical protein
VSEAFGRMRAHARRTGDQLTSVAEAVVAARLQPDNLQPAPDAR